jgi:predicted nucleic acid-binding protein
MSGDVFFDTNVLIYTVVKDDPRAKIAVAELAKGGTISVQVLNEFVNTARRKLKRSWPEVRQALAAFNVLCPQPLALRVATHEAALEIAQRHGFSFYDSLIVASAVEAGCSTLLSEDMQNGQVIAGRLTIRNPFVGC